MYKNGPDPASNTISGLQNDMEYLKSSTLTFNAVGAGMDNTNPNPGDYRYRPTGYQIGSVTGSWTQAPYQTSMAINAVGDYTLTVTSAKMSTMAIPGRQTERPIKSRSRFML